MGNDALSAELPLARLSTIFPPGGSTGASVEVTVRGVDLDGATQLLFSNPHIKAHLKENEHVASEPIPFLIAIGSNIPPGTYEVRVGGRFGVSNPRPFVVSDLLEMTPSDTNHSPATATFIPMGTVVNGYTPANGIGFFKFQAAKGERLFIECLSQEIDSRLEPTLLVSDVGGRELDRNRRHGFLDFTAPSDGEYNLRLHDSLFRGGPEYYYRLSLSRRPHLDSIFPPASLPGVGKFQIYGRNLPGSTDAHELSAGGKLLQRLEIEQEVPLGPSARQELPASVPLSARSTVLDAIEYRLTSTNGTSNPVLLSRATAPNVVVEAEPNDSARQAQIVSLPCEVVGHFYPGNDRDWIAFEAKKNDVYWIEVFSHRLGLQTDPFVLVQQASRGATGEEQFSDVQEIYDSDSNIGGVEFNTASRDPAWRFEVKQDGAYRVQVRDLFNGAGRMDPDRVYRLALRKEAPDFRLLAIPQPPPQLDRERREARVWTTYLRRGETLPIKILIFRLDNFDGEVALAVEGLPPGVTCSQTIVAAGRSSAVLLLSAAETVSSWAGPIHIVGKATLGTTELVHQARAATLCWDVNDYNLEPVRSRLVQDLYLATSGHEIAPVSVEAAEQKSFVATAGGKLKIPLRLISHGELTGMIKVKATGLPALDSLKEIEIKAPAAQATLDLDLSQHKIPPGTHQFYVWIQAQTKYRRLPAEQVSAAGDLAKSAEQAAKAAEQMAAELKTAADQAKAALTTNATAADMKTAADAAARAQEAQKKKEELAQAAKAAAARLQFEDRSITAYSTMLTLKVAPAAVTAAVAP